MSLISVMGTTCRTHRIPSPQITNHSTALLDFFVQRELGLNERAPACNRAVVSHALTGQFDVVYIATYRVSHADHPHFDSSRRKTDREPSSPLR